jgi:hypothetical protein
MEVGPVERWAFWRLAASCFGEIDFLIKKDFYFHHKWEEKLTVIF